MVPALAVADALRAEGAQVSFVGGDRAEAELVPAAGYRFERLRIEGLSRSNPLRALRAAVLAALALPRAWVLLGRLAPNAVMGGGGYVAGPVGVAALARRIPLVLTEADSHLGLTNRVLAPFARRVCLAFPLAGREGPRYLVSGRPVPRAEHDRERARERFGIGSGETCVLVFGGSLGARSINRAAVEGLADAPFRVLHVAGVRDYPELSARIQANTSRDGGRSDRQIVQGAATVMRAGGPARAPAGTYDLREYLTVEDFTDALAASDLVVGRSGGSVFELAAHGLPAILIPYPYASADHQSANARWMSDAGAAVVIPDGELSAERLRGQVEELLSDRGRLARMAAASRSLARTDAAGEVARELLEAAA